MLVHRNDHHAPEACGEMWNFVEQVILMNAKRKVLGEKQTGMSVRIRAHNGSVRRLQKSHG
jgi:hypothetical protein